MGGHEERCHDAASRNPGMPTAVRVVLLVRKVYASSHPWERSSGTHPRARFFRRLRRELDRDGIVPE